MLFFFTALTDFLGMAACLWLATYLLARGFPSRITFRAVVVLVALAAFFLNAYLNIHYPTPGTQVWRAGFLTVGFVAWYDLTYRLLPPSLQQKTRWARRGVYTFGLLALALLAGVKSIFVDAENALFVTRVNLGPGYIAYGLCLAAITTATLYNLRAGARAGAGPHNRFFFAATVIAAGTTIAGYGLTALSITPRTPRLVQDGLLLSAVSLLGYSVASHQALVERRTTLQDLPVSGIAIIGLSSLYAVVVSRSGFSANAIAFITVLAVLTHSAYDLVREFLDRFLHRHESTLREQLRRLAREVGGESALQTNLHEGLTSLCRALKASGGFIAARQEQAFIVSASVNSLVLGSAVAAAEVTGEDLRQPATALAEKVVWLAPAFVGGEQVAVIGLSQKTTRGKYSEADLGLLMDTADWVGLMVSTHAQQQDTRERLKKLAAEVEAREINLQAAPEDLISALENTPDTTFVRWVEEGLRNLSDYAALGQSPLAARLGVEGGTHIERGKAVRQELMQAIETLRPAARRPPEPLPREWHSYAVLYDAYIEDAPNREIMARLYISEGAFSRLRRKALRAVARHLVETKSQASTIPATASQAALGA